MKFTALRSFHLLAGLCLFGSILIQGCSTSSQLISEQIVEDKVAKIKLGQTTMAEIETLFGSDRVNDRRRWTYALSDTEFRIAERQRGRASGIFPFELGSAATNTRAVISVWFNDDGIVKGLEIARYFDMPFVNDYWYLVKASEQSPLEAVARAGESSQLKVVGSDKGTSGLTLEDGASKARISVKLEKQILHLTSNNPHPRLSKEYRIFAKKEFALIGKLAAWEL